MNELAEASPLYNGELRLHQADFRIMVFQLNEEPATEEMADDSAAGDEIPACKQWILPSREFHGLWESLVYDEGIKHNLLDYAHTTMLFSEKKVNTNLISWNRVILLHGPVRYYSRFLVFLF